MAETRQEIINRLYRDKPGLVEAAIRRGRVDVRDFNREERQALGDIIAGRGRTAEEFALTRTPIQPTQTENELGASLVPELRNRPAEEVVRGQSLQAGYSRQPSRELAAARGYSLITPEQSQQIENSQQVQINPNTGRPYGTVTSSSTVKEYGQFIKTKPFIRGTKEYAFEKARGTLARRFEGGGQNPLGGTTGERVSMVAQTGLYFVPYGGQALAAAETSEQLLTKKGRAEIAAISKEISEKYGVSEQASKTALVAASAITVIPILKSGKLILEKRALERIIRDPAIQFVSLVDESGNIKTVAKAEILGKQLRSISKSKVAELAQGVSGKGAVGKEVSFYQLPKGKSEAVLSDTAAISKELPGSIKILTPINNSPIREIARTVEGTAFLTTGFSVPRQRALFRSSEDVGFLGFTDDTAIGRLKSLFLKSEKLEPSLQRTTLAGVTRPYKGSENIISYLGGAAKLRIYKQGGIRYTFKPKIRGFIKFAGGGEIDAGSRALISRSIPLGTVQKEIRTIAQRIAKPRFLGLEKQRKILKSTRRSLNTGQRSVKTSIADQIVGQRSLSLTSENKKTAQPSFNILSRGSESTRTASAQTSRSRSAFSLPKATRTELQQVPKAIEEGLSAAKQGLAVSLSPSLRSGSLSRPRTRTRITPTNRVPIPFTPLRPRTAPPGIPKLLSFSNEVTGNKYPRSERLNFEAFTRRYGKLKRVAQGSRFENVFGAGVERARKTLGASVLVTRGGKKVSLPKIVGFTYSKRDPYVIVQERGKRLADPFEAREIAAARSGRITI